MTTSGTSRVFAAALLAATLLPYSGPGICTTLGRMGADVQEMTLTSSASGAMLSAPSSMMECCSFEGCGVPQAGPAVFRLPLPADYPVSTVAPRSAQPTPPQTSPDPLIRPPRA